MGIIEVPREAGQITVESTGSGPLVLCVPGMGETRAAFRHLVPGLDAASRALLRVLLCRPWGRALWSKHYRSLFGEQLRADHQQHVTQTLVLLRAPGRWRPFQRTTRTSHAPATAVLDQVPQPTLVLMGDKDPDFSDPAAEALLIAQTVGGQHQMVLGAGNYPMGEQPEVVLAAVTKFFAQVQS